jgi:phenylacetate-coenzyme A ligase PaaK-like adenylate-forming protein
MGRCLQHETELKHAIDDSPFGATLCVPPEQVKRVYQTSGTAGAPSVLALSVRT